MEIYIYQDGQQVGPYSDEQIRGMVASRTISETDLGWHEGLPEWQPLNTILAFVPPALVPTPTAPTSVKAKESVIQTNVKQGALVGGVVCFILGIGLMFLSMWSFIFYGPLFLVGFILSIVAMAQRRILGGIMLLLATLVVPAVLGLILFSTRTVKFADKLKKQIDSERVSEASTKTSNQPVANQPDESQPGSSKSLEREPVASQPTADEPVASQPATPVQSKHPDLDAKMGFRTYKLGTPFARFNPNDLNEGTAFVKSDLKAFFVKDFDKKLGAAEIDDLQLNFLQDILQSVMVKVKGEQSSLALKEVLIAAYGQPDETSSMMENTLTWNGNDCILTFTTGLMGDSHAEFSSKTVDAKIQAITAQKAKAGAAEGVKGL